MAPRMETARWRFQPGDVTAMPPAGKVRSSLRAIVTDADGVVDTVDYHLDAGALVLNFRREFTVLDFDADGTKDPSTAAAVFVRR
jgi:hypothetical protein